MTARAFDAVAEHLGRFSDDMTSAVDRAFGSDWAENDEILALVEIVTGGPVTTRRIAEASGLQRRAVSRLVARLSADGLVTAAPSAADRRAVEITLTTSGRRRADQLRAGLEELYRASKPIAEQIVRGLGGDETSAKCTPAADPVEVLRQLATEGALLVSVFADRAGPHRLAGRQRAALAQISARDGIRPADLSPSLGMTRGGVSYVVDQLCATGLVNRHHGARPQDRRAVILEITPAGREYAGLLTEAITERKEGLVSIFAQIASRNRKELL